MRKHFFCKMKTIKIGFLKNCHAKESYKINE